MGLISLNLLYCCFCSLYLVEYWRSIYAGISFTFHDSSKMVSATFTFLTLYLHFSLKAGFYFSVSNVSPAPPSILADYGAGVSSAMYACPRLAVGPV